MQLHTRTPGIHLGAMPDSSLAFAQNVAGMWLFDEGAGDAILDSGIYANHGTLVGGVKRAESALQFDGVTGCASIPHSPSLMPSLITVILRTRNLANPAQFDSVLTKCSNSNWQDGYGIFYDSPHTLLKFWVGHSNSGGIASISVNPLAVNTLVGTYDGAVIQLFANGTEGSPMNHAGGITANTGPLEFGRGRDNAYNINGLIYRVTILDYALPLDEALILSR